MQRPAKLVVTPCFVMSFCLGFPCAGKAQAQIPLNHADAERLAAQVTIRRDTFGVPHILADNETAAAFGHGYANAEDNVRTLGHLFLQARGEEAAHFGEAVVENDFLIKQFHIHSGAAAGYAKSSPWLRG